MYDIYLNNISAKYIPRGLVTVDASKIEVSGLNPARVS
jgi:hypothetical protein